MCFLKLCYSMMITFNKGSFTYFILLLLFFNSIHSIFQWFNFECQPNLLFNVCNLMLIWKGGGHSHIGPWQHGQPLHSSIFQNELCLPPPPHPPQVGHWSSWALEPGGHGGFAPPQMLGKGGWAPPQCWRGAGPPNILMVKYFNHSLISASVGATLPSGLASAPPWSTSSDASAGHTSESMCHAFSYWNFRLCLKLPFGSHMIKWVVPKLLALVPK